MNDTPTPPAPDGPIERLAGAHILLVEDEALIALDLVCEFERFGAAVIGPAARLPQALELSAKESISVAVLDVDLQGEDVLPVAQALARRGIPFLFHTGHGTRYELSSRFPDAPVCPKPVSAERLARVIAGLL